MVCLPREGLPGYLLDLLFLFPDESLGIGAEDVVLMGQQQREEFCKGSLQALALGPETLTATER